MGWYAANDGSIRSKGTMYFVLHPHGLNMSGRWVGLGYDDKIMTGWGSMARTAEEAEAVIEPTQPAQRAGITRMTELCEVVITAPDPEWLADLTRALVAEGLCASAHNFTPVRSIYRWQGQIHERTEGRASLHTRAELVSRIVDRVRSSRDIPTRYQASQHDQSADGNPDYLQWIADETDHHDQS